MFNKITTTLIAKDEVSPKLKQLQGNLKNTGSISQGLGFVAKGAFVGIAAGVAAATAGVVGLGLAFNQASGIAQNALNAANNLSVELGDALSLNQAQELIKTVNKELALSAAALPGTTQEYVSIFNRIQNDIARAFKNPDGTLNVEGWKDSATEISTLFGVIFSDVADRGKVENAVQKLMTGNATLREMMQYDFIASNVALVNGLAQAEKDLGKEMKQWSDKERVEVLKSLKSTLLSEEYLAELESSASAVLAGFQSAVFDPSTGIFGIMRELEGGGSVFESLSETVRLLFGSKGLISTIVNDLFGVVDPMESLNNFVIRINKAITRLSDFYNNFDFKTPKLNFDFSSIGEKLAKLVNLGLQKVGALDFGLVARTVGTFVANALKIGASNLYGYLVNLDWGQIASIFLRISGAFVQGVGAFLTTLVPGINSLVSFGQQVAGFLNATLLNPIRDFFFILGFSFTNFLVPAVNLLIAPFRMFFSGIVFSFQNILIPAVSIMISPIVGVINLLGLAIVNSFNFIRSNWDTASKLMSQAVGVVMPSINNFVSVVTNVATALRWGADKLRQLTSMLRSSSSTPTGSMSTPGNSFNGNFPGVFGAIARELINSPSGSRPVVANSSELILNPQQQAALFGSLNRGSNASSSNQTTIALGGINIQAGQNQSPVEIANAVIREIENRLVKAYQV